MSPLVRECPRCGGSGDMPNRHGRVYSHPNDPRRDDCSRCDGSGEVEAPCPVALCPGILLPDARCSRGHQFCKPCVTESDTLVLVVEGHGLCAECILSGDAEIHGGGALVAM